MAHPSRGPVCLYTRVLLSVHRDPDPSWRCLCHKYCKGCFASTSVSAPAYGMFIFCMATRLTVIHGFNQPWAESIQKNPFVQKMERFFFPFVH